jgi:ferredoxin-nitrite reductase
VQVREEDELVEGYHVLIGGGFGPHAAIGRELYRDVTATETPRMVERILKAYLTHRSLAEESFLSFARRHDIDALKAMTDLEAAE